MIDLSRVDHVVQFALAAASGEDDRANRELGPIHLLKHVYLADLAHADRHGGATFTGAPWRFHHFGPWTVDVYNRIGPATSAVGAAERRFTSTRSDTDGVRYRLYDAHLLDRLENQLPTEVSGAVRRAVRSFGSDTASLLQHVYLTRPMLRAAPEEYLDFAPDAEEPAAAPAAAPSLTPREQRDQKAAIRALRERFRRRVLERPKPAAAASPPPRYDEIFWEGVRMLDELAGQPVAPGEATMTVDEGVWKSRARRDPGIP
jgi:hypothetical protein